MQFKTKAIASALVLASGLVFSATSAADDQARATMLSYTCAGCHGPDGSSEGPATPTIAGLGKESFVAAMTEYQKDERPSTIMGRLAKGYTQSEIEAMADFFAKQTFKVFQQEHDPAKAQAGKKLHDDFCEKCHVDGGVKDEDGSSILAGQWMPYLHFQFEDFHSEARAMPKKMKKQMDKLANEDKDGIDKLVHYYGSRSK